MSGKSRSYKVLSEESFSGFDAVAPAGSRKSKGCKWWQYVALAIVSIILVVVILTLITVVVVEIIQHKNTSTANTLCPSNPPTIKVPCAKGLNVSEEVCTNAGCCWYGDELDQCYMNYEASCSNDQAQHFNCLPENDSWNNVYAKQQCTLRGCCWDSSSTIKCFFPSNYGYRINDDIQETATGMIASITRKMPQPTIYGNDIENLTVEVIYETSNRLHIKIYDDSITRYQVPLYLTSPVKPPTLNLNTLKYSVNFTRDTFGFEIQRTIPTKRTIFKTAPGFSFSDQFLQLSAYIPSHFIYGLGEHATPWKLDTNYTKLTMFSRDIPPDPVNDPNRNLYGVHPFYLCMESDGNAHGVFFLNSNAMEAELLPYPAISYRTIGGLLDFYYFLGPTPDDVVTQYTELIGRPFMPPYWSLGFHLCRWGYLTANRTQEVVERMRSYGIPQDTQWNDIDYMNIYLDFTYNHTTFEQLPQLVDNLHSHGQRYIVITDPGISAVQSPGTYPPYDDGLKKGVFILNSTGKPILGTVWPGVTVYPDFTNPESQDYWEQEIVKFHDIVGFDGLWIDMNEPSNFQDGSIYGCPNSSLNTPPYLPAAIRQSWNPNKILEKTLCMTAKQNLSLHYNVHSLYGHTEAIATMTALQKKFNKRSVVISRSTYPGSGTHCGHWLGDNASQWPHIRQSIPGILNFALFGIPLVGADICGFFVNTTEQLCTRWQQLGAFYPFSRNHNTYNTIAQDPTAFSNYSISSTRDALLTRYKLLPFLYTLFYYAHVNGSTVARPLLSVFPKDTETWWNGHQFMWGDSLLISPVLEENAVSVVAYFPKARWYDYRNGTEVFASGSNITLEAPLNYIPLHVKGGSIIPQQAPNTTTTYSRQNSYSLLVALNDVDNANGHFFIDDGEEINSIENGNYTLINYEAKTGQLKSKVVTDGYRPLSYLMDDVIIYGLTEKPNNLTLNNIPLSVGQWTWIPQSKVLTVSVNLSDLMKEFILKWE